MISRLNPAVLRVEDPPIREAQDWLKGTSFSPDKPLIDLSQALPSYPPAEELRYHLAELVRKVEMSAYTQIGGLPELREAYTGELSRVYGTGVGPGEVFICAGCNQGFFLSMLAIAGHEDEVILPSPYYFNHRMTLELIGIKPVLLPCVESEGMLPDPETAEMLLTKRTRAVVLVTPNNPTGSVYPRELIHRFFDWAHFRGIRLVLDETYRDFLKHDQGKPHELLEESWQETLVQLYSFSKSFARAGYRIGAITASPELLRQIEKVMDCVAICASHLSQRAVIFALERLDTWREGKRELMNTRAGAFRKYFEQMLKGSFRMSSIGPCFAYISYVGTKVSSGNSAKSLAREKNILLLPGSMFGSMQESFLRVAFANVDVDCFPEMMARLRDFSANN